jgi:hypothetical protein
MHLQSRFPAKRNNKPLISSSAWLTRAVEVAPLVGSACLASCAVRFCVRSDEVGSLCIRITMRLKDCTTWVSRVHWLYGRFLRQHERANQAGKRVRAKFAICSIWVHHVCAAALRFRLISFSPFPSTPTSHPNVCTKNSESSISARRSTISRWSRQRPRALCRRPGSWKCWWECSESQRSRHPIYRHRCSSIAAQRSVSGLSARSLCLPLCHWCGDSQDAHHKSRCVASIASGTILLISVSQAPTHEPQLSISL